MKSVEEMWNEAAKQCYASCFVNCEPLWQLAVTRFAELVRADCQAVPTETAEEVYEACRDNIKPHFHHLPFETQAFFIDIVERARSGPPKPKTPGERLKEWVNERFGCPSCGVDDWEFEAAKLIGGNDG